MSDAWTADVQPLDVIEIARVFEAHDVRCVFVGGIAAIAHGYPRSTADVDIVPDRDRANLDRLCDALRALGARLFADPRRGDLREDGSPPEANGFELSGDHLATQLAWHFSTNAGPLDVLLAIWGPGGYEVLLRNAEERVVDGHRILIASLDDLIESKETTARSKDLAALDELRAIRDQRR